MVISSKDNETIKHIKKLKEKKYRDEYNEFVVEGFKMIEEAINENAKIKKIIICEDCRESCAIPQNLMYEVAKYNCIYVTEKIFDSITNVVNHQGMMAIIDKSEDDLKINYNESHFLILNDVQDPGNIGTILRTADSLNIKQIIVSNKTADIYNPKVVRSTMGAIFRVKVIVVDDLVKEIKNLKSHGIKVYATDLNTEESIYTVDYNKVAVVIGNEANGVSKEILEASDGRIKIPMLGKTESLNAAVATSIILFEIYRDELKNK